MLSSVAVHRAPRCAGAARAPWKFRAGFARVPGAAASGGSAKRASLATNARWRACLASNSARA
eukprot:8794498-Alexandrium_andersonii.AAC.1